MGSNFVLIEQHVGNTVGDGKHAPCLGALELSLKHVDFEEQMMKSHHEINIIMHVLWLRGGNVIG